MVDLNLGSMWHSLYLPESQVEVFSTSVSLNRARVLLCDPLCEQRKQWQHNRSPVNEWGYEELPDVGHRVIDQIKRLNKEVLAEVGFGEQIYGNITQVQKPQPVPVASTLSKFFENRRKQM